MQSYMHMRCQARQLDSYSSAQHCSTARQLDSSTATRQTSTRQTSTELDAPAHGVSLDRLDKARQARPRQQARQRLDSASTARQLDSQGSTRVRLSMSGARKYRFPSFPRFPPLNLRLPPQFTVGSKFFSDLPF